MRNLFDEFLPDHCVLCAIALRPRYPHLLCPHCWHDLPWLTTHCRHCAVPLSQSGVCGSCQAKPLVRGTAVAALVHANEGQYLVQRAKFHHGFREAQTLGFCLSTAVLFRHTNSLPSAIVCTPISFWRLAQRGFNQSRLIANVVSKCLDIPIIHPLARRHRPPQRTLNSRKRRALSKASFPKRASLQHKHVAIIDDVLTTGSTVSAMAEALGDLGAHRVDVWCATRAIATVGNEHTL